MGIRKTSESITIQTFPLGSRGRIQIAKPPLPNYAEFYRKRPDCNGLSRIALAKPYHLIWHVYQFVKGKNKGNAAHAGELHGATESRGLSFCRDEISPLEVHFSMRLRRKRPQTIGDRSFLI